VRVAVAVLLVVALVGVVLGGALPWPFESPSPPDGNATDDAPGDRLAGVLGVHGAEVRGELAAGSLDARLAAANDDAARAAVVATETAAVEARLSALERQRAALDGPDDARLADIAAAALALERQVARLDGAAAALPDAALADAGVEPGSLGALGDRAGALADAKALAAAREVAGPDAGLGYGDDDDDADDDGEDSDEGDDGDDDPDEGDDEGETPDDSDDESDDGGDSDDDDGDERDDGSDDDDDDGTSGDDD
jgi:hypothetical protein